MDIDRRHLDRLAVGVQAAGIGALAPSRVHAAGRQVVQQTEQGCRRRYGEPGQMSHSSPTWREVGGGDSRRAQSRRAEAWPTIRIPAESFAPSRFL